MTVVPNLDARPSRFWASLDFGHPVFGHLLCSILLIGLYFLLAIFPSFLHTQQKSRNVTQPEPRSDPELPFELKNLEKGDKNSTQSLEDYLSTRSYIAGFEPTTSDNLVFDAVNKAADSKTGDLYPNLRRWHHHIESFGNERKKFVVIKN